MKHYLMINESTGEEILVGAETQTEAFEVAFDAFPDTWEFVIVDTLTEEEAEASGLDEY